MAEHAQYQPPERLLVVMPSWVGDTVMATPTLRALRHLYPQAHIAALARPAVRPMIDACPWLDRILTIRPARKGMADLRRRGIFNLARRLAAGRFDTAILLPNSFRSALLIYLTGIRRRIGYDRDARGSLLTDRLLARRAGGKFVPVPTRDYYLGITRYLGAVDPDATLQLFTRPEDDARADRLLAAAGYDPAGRQKLVLLNPGANYGDAKMWPPARFAQLADRLCAEYDAVVALSGAPKERPILDQVIQAAGRPLLDLPKLGVDLTLLKSVVQRSSLLVTNDTGPRHIAAALGTPVVTVFGPTDPAWTEIGFALERQVMVKVFCGPCQLKKCPLDHRCMTQIDAGMVLVKAQELWRVRAGASVVAGKVV